MTVIELGSQPALALLDELPARVLLGVVQDDTANLYGDEDDPPPSEPDRVEPAAADPLDELLEGVLPGTGPVDAPPAPIMAAAGTPTTGPGIGIGLARRSLGPVEREW